MGAYKRVARWCRETTVLPLVWGWLGCQAMLWTRRLADGLRVPGIVKWVMLMVACVAFGLPGMLVQLDVVISQALGILDKKAMTEGRFVQYLRSTGENVAHELHGDRHWKQADTAEKKLAAMQYRRIRERSRRG